MNPFYLTLSRLGALGIYADSIRADLEQSPELARRAFVRELQARINDKGRFQAERTGR